MTDGSVAHRLSLLEPSRHRVTLAADGKVARAYRERSRQVTSYHHQGLAMPDSPDSPWRATAHSDDALVEAIEHVGDGWAVGVLWHPELPTTTAPDESPASLTEPLAERLTEPLLEPLAEPLVDPLISAFVLAARQSHV